jgi:spore coat polysaccharide biosynthesis protein SpsF (cytidylyltransferase family)
MEPTLKTILITQARTGSTRLPNKVLKKINGEELLRIHLNRLKQVKGVDKLMVATTTDTKDQMIVDLCAQMNIPTYRGSEDNVLDRFYKATKAFAPQWVIRVTSDCPLIDPHLIEAVLSCAQVNDADYCSNVLVEHFPDGQDVEVFKFSALQQAWEMATLNSDKEHVTPFIRKNSTFFGKTTFKALNFPCIADYNDIRMTVDEQRDFDMMEQLIHHLGTDKDWLTYTKFIINNNLKDLNADILRNEGYAKSLQKD